MTGFVTAYFDEKTVRDAVGGCCHDFAIALHRSTGWPIACLWLDSLKDGFSVTDEPMPLHLFCVAPDGRAVDAEGAAAPDVLAGRYVRSGRDRGRQRTETIGSEADWERVAREVSTARSLAPRERGIEAAASAISGSPAFLDLVADLSTAAPAAHA